MLNMQLLRQERKYEWQNVCVCDTSVCSGTGELQRQTEVAGAPSAEDLAGSSPIQQPEEGNGVGQTLPHAGPRQVEPRVFVQSFDCYSF